MVVVDGMVAVVVLAVAAPGVVQVSLAVAC
jgi:hypothetical protein